MSEENRELSELSKSFSRLEGMLESKLDSLIEEIRELKEADQNLHDRISEKDKIIKNDLNELQKSTTEEINDIKDVDKDHEKRLSRLETLASIAQWGVATIIAAAAAIFTYFQIKN